MVNSAGEVRFYQEVMLELAHRAGFADEVYGLMNLAYRLEGLYKLDTKQTYAMEDIFDRRAKALFGDEMGLDWFKEHGSYKVKRDLEETYPESTVQGRFPLYFENILRAGKDVERTAKSMGIEWDTEDYKATLHWRPCDAFSREAEEKFYVVNYRSPLHALTYTIQNPWLNELGGLHPSAYKVLINTEAALSLGIEDGDTVLLESEAGAVTGVARVTEGIHPEVVGIAGNFGGKSLGRPVARGVGIHFNTLVSIDMGRIDPISGGLDSCVRVKVSKVFS